MVAPYSPRSQTEFVKYCHLYDPFVPINNPRVVSEFADEFDEFGESIYGEIFSEDIEVDDDEIKIYWRCESHLESDKGLRSSKNRTLASEIQNELLEVRGYIYYELHDCSFQWAVVRYWMNREGEIYRKFFGVGATLGDADQVAIKEYSNYIQERDQTIRFIFEQGVPLSTDDFIDLGKRYNLEF
ncbi:hypothetical protein, partial [Leptolyngbya sp. FACHB-711]|uniref:hypothetical protein n=1 Tax=Leptolyngbya sp. FACHB-711 TaxID=2692813 RepID=UPI0016855DE6